MFQEKMDTYTNDTHSNRGIIIVNEIKKSCEIILDKQLPNDTMVYYISIGMGEGLSPSPSPYFQIHEKNKPCMPDHHFIIVAAIFAMKRYIKISIKVQKQALNAPYIPKPM